MKSASLGIEWRSLEVLLHPTKMQSYSSFSFELLDQSIGILSNRSEIVEHVDGSFGPGRLVCGATFNFGDGVNLVSHLHKSSPSRPLPANI
jgi:hypothetical protein